MAAAHRGYLRRRKKEERSTNGSRSDIGEVTVLQTVVLQVVSDDDSNEIDQRLLQFSLETHHAVRTVRYTPTQLLSLLHQSQLLAWPVGGKPSPHLPTSADLLRGRLLILADAPIAPVAWEVSLIYLRTFYDPSHYPTLLHWRLRELLELSEAVKCPSMPAVLAGSKKAQELFSRQDVLERYVHSKSERDRLAAVFVPQVDPSEERHTSPHVLRALECPEEYVLKPQREGGGNNLYCEDLRSALQSGLGGYILMKRICPPKRLAVLLGAHTVLGRGETEASVTLSTGRGRVYLSVTPCVSELGIFGYYLADEEGMERGELRDGPQKDEMEGARLNASAGYLLRTKPAEVQEGGVAAGYAAIDSLVLV